MNVKQAKTEIDLCMGDRSCNCAYAKGYLEAIEQTKPLVEGFKKYAQHLPMCASLEINNGGCDCGLDKALSEYKKSVGE